MALYKEPKPELLQDGDQPSVMNYSDEYWRTNTNLSKDRGRAPSFEKVADPRLPGLFSFEYGGQYGEVAIPKGRIVAVSSDKQFKDLNSGKFYPGITLANGGEDVQEKAAEHYQKTFKAEDVDEEGYYVRAANKPVGVSTLNIYQDHRNSFKGNRPGFITRNTVEVPLFKDQETAEQMEWGSAYGSLEAGDKVMSDPNGRFVGWKEGKLRREEHTVDTDNGYTIDDTANTLTFNLDVALFPAEDPSDEVTIYVEEADEMKEVENAIMITSEHTGEIEVQDIDGSGDNTEITNGDVVFAKYRSILSNAEQMIGQVLAVQQNLIPAGWTKWVQPDEGVFTDFGDRYTEPTGLTPELVDGAPVFDPSFGRHEKYRPTSIPGILDGMNYIKEYKKGADEDKDGEDDPQFIGRATATTEWEDGDLLRLRLPSHLLPVEEIKGLVVVNQDGDEVTHIAEETIADYILRQDVSKKYNVSGLLEFEATGDLLEALDTTSEEVEEGGQLFMRLEFTARHQMPGMPTHMDWDGCVGSVDILLQL